MLLPASPTRHWSCVESPKQQDSLKGALNEDPAGLGAVIGKEHLDLRRSSILPIFELIVNIALNWW